MERRRPEGAGSKPACGPRRRSWWRPSSGSPRPAWSPTRLTGTSSPKRSGISRRRHDAHPRTPLDALAAALDRCSAAFPEARLPCLRRIGSAGGLGGEALEVAVGMLRRAVVANEPLDPWAIMAALGIRRPPDGPVP